MTDLGRLHLQTWLHLRPLFLGLALAVILAFELRPQTGHSLWLWGLLGLDLGVSLAALYFSRFWEPVRTVRLLLLLDTAVIAAAVFYSGGLEGGLTLLYIPVILTAYLGLGQRSAFAFSLLCLACILVQFGLDRAGVVAYPNGTPGWLDLAGQGMLVLVFVVLALFLARASVRQNRQLRADKSAADRERAIAERGQERWALINTVALRVQESTTQQEVYRTIGEELERVGLHCVIFEWRVPGEQMQISYTSLSPQMFATMQAQFRVDPDAVVISLSENDILRRAIVNQTPFLVEDAVDSVAVVLPSVSRAVLEKVYAEFEIERVVYAPMSVGEQVIGVLVIFGKTPDESDLAPFAALARQAASALEKARLITEQNKRAAQLEAVSNLATQLSRTRDTQELVAFLPGAIGKGFGYDRVWLALVDEQTNRLGGVFTYPNGHDPQVVDLTPPPPILEDCARLGTLQLTRDSRILPSTRTAGAAEQHSELAIPLLSQERVLGVLAVQSSEAGGFAESDLRALSIVGEQLAAAISRGRAFALEQRRAAHLALVGEIAARAAAFSDPDAIVRTMVDLVQTRFGYHHVCVSLYDAARDEMEQHAVAGPNAHLYTVGARWSAREGLVGLAARTRQAILSGDLLNDPRYAPDPDRLARSALSVPLLSGKQVLGVLDIESDERNAFDVNDLAAMETLANQMAAALEKARSLEAERRRTAQLALVNRIASHTARLMPTGRLLREAVEMIQAQFGYYNVAVLSCDPAATRGGEFATVSLLANAGGLSQQVAVGDVVLRTGLIAHVGAAGSTYLCTDPQHDPYYQSPFPPGTADPVRAEIAIPMRRGETIIGVLDIQCSELTTFQASDITALEALADQLATALENSRLFDSEARRVAQLDSVRSMSLQLTAEHDLDALLHSIVASAATLARAESAALYMVDEPRGEIVVRISQNHTRNLTGTRLRIGEGLAGRVAQDGAARMTSDYGNWGGRAEAYADDHLARVLAVPLKWQERVLGVINLHRPAAHPMFDQDELRLANLFAAQAAVALENARLLNALRARLRAGQTLSEISATLLETTDPQTILVEAARAAQHALEGNRAVIYLPDAAGRLSVSAQARLAALATEGDTVPAHLDALARRAYSSRAAVHEGEHGTAHLTAESATGVGAGSGIAAPMLVGEQVMGVVAVDSPANHPFDAGDDQTLLLLANQTAIALDRAASLAKEQARARELNMLFDGYLAATATLDPAEVLARLLEQLVRSLDVTSAFFVEYDAVDGVLRQAQEFCAPDAAPSERSGIEREWYVTRSLEVQTVLTRETRITQADSPNLSVSEREFMQAQQVKTILRVPVIAADELVGFLSLWETRAARNWTPDQVRFVQTMTSQAAAALVNARLYQAAQTRSRELQGLHQISRQLSASLDVPTILENSADSLRDVLGYEYLGIYFVQDNVLRLQVQRGYPNPLDEIPLARGIMARAVMTRSVIYLPDVSRDAEFLAAHSHTRSEIAVPLIIGERVLGVLNVETQGGEPRGQTRRVLTPMDVQLLSTFANQLVIAIENARLFQETRRSLAQVQTLHSAGQAVNADLNLEGVLERVAREFVTALHVDSCTIDDWDHERGEIVVLFDLDPAGDDRVPSGTRAALDTEPLLRLPLESAASTAVRADDPELDARAREYLESYHWKSALFVPLVVKGRVRGIIELGDRSAYRAFRPDELRLAESLASQAAVTFENARLYREAQQRLQETETLYGFARELGATLDAKTLGMRALEAAARLADFDMAEVSLTRESDGALVPLVVKGSAETVETMSLPRGVGITGWVALHGQSVRSGDVTRDSRYQPSAPNIRSEVCLPLRVGDRTIGVLNLESCAADAFDAHTEQLLAVFASQLAIAVENARLYEQTKRDAEVKAALLRELSHRVKNNLAAITSLLYMALDEPTETREQLLNETLGRVQSMSIAHALLARSGEARVDVLELGEQVLRDTSRQLARPGGQVEIEARGDTILIGARQTTTLALVLNELATNALRHGLGRADTDAAPILRFEAQRLGMDAALQVQDNGSGLRGFEPGLGLGLVRTLVEKDLQGYFDLTRNGEWTCARVRFRVEE